MVLCVASTMLQNRDGHMNQKRGLTACTCAFLLFVNACSSLIGVAAEPAASEASTSLSMQQPGGSWQEYAIYLISRRLCASPPADDKIWPEHACTSILAETLADVATASASDTPGGRLYFAPENLGSSDAVVPAEFTFKSSELVGEAYFSMPEFRPEKSVKLSEHRPDKLTMPSESVSGDAIPGSLLVTILALVGIVAVARRDVFRRTDTRLLIDASPDAARVAGLHAGRMP